MILNRSTILSLLIHGADLHIALVTVGPSGARVRAAPALRRFMTASHDELRLALAAARSPQGATVVLTLPSALCAIRPVPITTSAWAGARPELLRSIASLFPLTSDDAMVGLIDRAESTLAPIPDTSDAAGAGEAGGFLIAVRRSAVQPMIDALERALGRRIDAIQAPHCALLGLGLQRCPLAAIIEPAAGGATLVHRLRYARPELLGEPIEDVDPADTPELRTLLWPAPGDQPAQAQPDATSLTPDDLAVGAALARAAVHAGAAPFAPLHGRPAAAPRRWLVPAAVVAAAVAVIWGGFVMQNSRYRARAERFEVERASLAAAVQDAQRQSDELDRYASLVRTSLSASTAESQQLMPLLAAAQGAIPGDGFIYRLELDARTVTIKGEAARSLEVLSSLEATPQFQNAESLEPPATISDRALETFNVRARRTPPPAAQGGRAP